VPQPILASFARELVLVHAIVAFVLVGAVTHHAIVALDMLRGSFRARLTRVYAKTTAVCYVATMALGALAYPTFRVHARAYLDADAPWASALFEAKEDVATIALPLVLATWIVARSIDPRQDRRHLPGYVAMVLFSAGAVWFELTSGLLVTMVRGL
jgi:hypothetical protein